MLVHSWQRRCLSSFRLRIPADLPLKNLLLVLTLEGLFLFYLACLQAQVDNAKSTLCLLYGFTTHWIGLWFLHVTFLQRHHVRCRDGASFENATSTFSKIKRSQTTRSTSSQWLTYSLNQQATCESEIWADMIPSCYHSRICCNPSSMDTAFCYWTANVPVGWLRAMSDSLVWGALSRISIILFLRASVFACAVAAAAAVFFSSSPLPLFLVVLSLLLTSCSGPSLSCTLLPVPCNHVF